MGRTFPPIDRQPQASTGKHSQAGLHILSEVSHPHQLAAAHVAKATFNGCLTAAAQHSGLDDHEIADQINICHGYMSRFMRGIAQQWAKRMVAFMRTTQSLAPLQWMADQMGCDVVLRAGQAARIAELQAELAQLTRRQA